MNILWVSHFLPYPEVGFGALQRSRGLLTEMCKKHDVYLLSYDRAFGIASGGDLGEAKKDLQKLCREVMIVPYPWSDVIFQKVRLAIRGARILKPYSVSMYMSEMIPKQALEAIEAFDIDLVHADTMGLIDSVIGRMKIKAVLNHHNIESDMMRRRARKTRNIMIRCLLYFEAWMLKAYEIRTCRKYNLNVCVSELDRFLLRQNVKGIKTAVIENPVDCSYYRFEEHRPRGRKLIFAGSLDWYPNANAMIDFCGLIWPHLKKNIPDLELIIVGRNPPKALREITERYRHIKMMGLVDDVRPLIKEATVYVCPIQDGGGTRLKILDALSQGIPIVATPMAVEGIDLTEGENILIAENREQFLERLKALFLDENFYKRVSISGRKFVEDNYTRESIGEKMSQLYEKVVGSQE